MLDKLIKQKAEQISYNKDELSNIASSSNHLREIIKNQLDFNSSFIGGSYKRHTLVKGISDIDIYYEYTSDGNPQTALTSLKSCLLQAYPNSIIKQDKPSVLVDFNRIPFNITPYKPGFNISIPDNQLMHWRVVNFGKLEMHINNLRAKSSSYIELIKILKLWNKNYNRGIKNYEIEEKMCNLFLSAFAGSNSISKNMLDFFFRYNFSKDANKFRTLVIRHIPEHHLKTEWLNFIENR